MLIKRIPILAVILVAAAGCCEKIKSDASDLKDKHAACEAGDTCVIVDMYAVAGDENCLGAFQCSVSLNEKNIEAFEKEARSLANDYEKCDECVTAGCADLSGQEPFCNETTGKCDTATP